VSEILRVLPPHVPQIYISKTPCHHVRFDMTLLGSCDEIVGDLVRRCGWRLMHDKLPGGSSDGCAGVEWSEVERGVWGVVELEREGAGNMEGVPVESKIEA
jgi:hypothetical protein